MLSNVKTLAVLYISDNPLLQIIVVVVIITTIVVIITTIVGVVTTTNFTLSLDKDKPPSIYWQG